MRDELVSGDETIDSCSRPTALLK